jgi:hypothetical protein
MANLEVPGRGKDTASGRYRLDPSTQIPCGSRGMAGTGGADHPGRAERLFQQDLVPTSSEVTRVSDAFLVPVFLSS